MKASDTLDLYTALQQVGITIWIDGGWAVDALLSEETRVHGDLDIVIEQQHVVQLQQLLANLGFKEIKQKIATPHNFVLADDKAREIDIHVIVIDEHGNGIYGPPENGVMYPAASLTGKGTITSRSVKCISAEYMVQFLAPWIDKHPHKYLPAVSALCERFGIDLPEAYVIYRSRE